MSTSVEADGLSRPMPTPDADSQAFWDGLREGVLRLQHCRSCGQVAAYHQAYCRRCGSPDSELRDATGYGVVHSFSVVHRAPGPAFRADVPYTILLVELDEGPRMISSLTGAGPDDVRFGMRVRLVCVPISEHLSLPRFAPAPS